MYGQTTQDGRSLILWISTLGPVPASPLSYSQDCPSYILASGPLVMTVFIKAVMRGMTLYLISLATEEPTGRNSLIIGNFPLPSGVNTTAMSGYHTWWGVTLGPCF